MTPQSRVRPTGVTILAVLAGIGGVLSLLLAVAAIGLAGVAAGSIGGQQGAALGGLVVFGGLIALVYGALSLAFAFGAWTLKPWAWLLGMAAQVLSLVSSALQVAGGGSISGIVVSVLIAIGILYYLNTPGVRTAFGRV
jgi:hypothetical protein